jgi:ribonuclease HII
MDIKEEKRLWKQGYGLIAGIDEAGRGPLAGPVVASALVLFSKNIDKDLFDLVNDSKKLSAKQRELCFERLQNEKQIAYGIGIVSEKMIDKINIFQATLLAMEKAVNDLAKKIGKSPDYLILDGRATIKIKIKQKAIVKADSKIFSCSAASIIAKVTRDRIMDRFDKKYPQYGFSKHKGYGTKLHFATIKEFGPCPIHRKTFTPIKNMSISAS